MTPTRAYAEMRGSRPRQVLRMVRRVWWTTLSSGRFFTGWTALVSFVIATTLLGAYLGIDAPREYLPAIAVSAIGWVVLVIAIVPVAWGERRLRRAGARAALVLTALVAAGIARPLINDGLSLLLLLPDPTVGGWISRILTNVFTWVLVLSLVAMATVGYGATQDAAGRLRVALANLGEADRRAENFARRSRSAIALAVARLRVLLVETTAGTPTFEDIRRFSAAVRTASHELEDAAAIPLAEIGAGTDPVPTVDTTRPILSRLRPPPPFTVAIVYIVGSLPYTLQSAPLYLVVVAVLLMLALGLAADLATRRIAARRAPEVRGAVLVVTWVIAGALFSAAATALLPGSWPVSLVPLIAIPGAAVIAAMSTDAIRRSVVQSRKLTHALAEQTDAVARRAARSRGVLRAAADGLHGAVQGRCVVFAASIEDAPATPDEARAFADAVGEALDGIELAPPPALARSAELDELLATWAHVLEISRRISPDARDVLARGDVARQVADVAAEGFVNAVKHSGARQATLSVRREAAGGDLIVEVSSRGVLARTLPIDRGRGVAHLGAQARVYQRGDDVVLESRVALADAALAPA